MVTEMNISQFRSWLNEAEPDDLVTIAPQLFSRIGTLDQRHQEQFIEQVQRDPQAKSLFAKLSTFSQ